ncbi:MAG TPA: ABC transporter permease [Streptosporangiaceae bacterium]|nr:ABC transporter permease [Streptosporangiaceae bacterium]
MRALAGTTGLTGTGTLIKLAFRRDRITLVIWIYALTAFVAATAYGFKKLYPAAPGRVEFVAAASSNPSLLSLYGPLYGTSTGSLVSWRDTALLGLAAGLMSIFLLVRHTRADEESGRLELVGATAIGRNAALASAIAVAGTANAVIFVTMTAVAILFGLPAAGSIAMAGGIAGCGLAFTGIAAVAAQLAQTARAARGVAFGAIAAAFLLRAVGDSAASDGPRWLSWLSPVGWAELVRSFGSIRWWLLALPLACAVLVAAVGAVLAANRDYDAGLIGARPGPPVASASLRNSFALAWRLQRGSLFAWVAGALVFGVLIGSAAKGIGGLIASSQVRRIVISLGGQAALTNAFFAAILGFVGLIVAGYAVSAVLRLRSEEAEGHAESVLSTGTGRLPWGGSHLIIAAAGTVAILSAAGLGAGLGYVYQAGGGGTELARLTLAGLAQAPAALVIGGVAAALFGLLPRRCVAVSWAVLGVVAAMLLLGAVLQLSHWVLDLSPFTHSPKLPGGTVAAEPLVLLGVIAALLAVAGLAGLRRRDVG